MLKQLAPCSLNYENFFGQPCTYTYFDHLFWQLHFHCVGLITCNSTYTKYIDRWIFKSNKSCNFEEHSLHYKDTKPSPWCEIFASSLFSPLCVVLCSFSSPGVSILSLGWQALSRAWHMDHSFDSTVTSERSAYSTERPENSRDVCSALIIPLRANNEFTGHRFRHNRWNGFCPRCIHWQKSWRKCHGKTGVAGDYWLKRSRFSKDAFAPI